jgi:predicted signal transduction protein with EAL and GGDEF domain
MAARQLVLEVTETAVFELGAPVTNLRALRETGVRISLDDFGTGQSTLTLLQNCEVDELKLDQSFTQAEVTGEPTIAAAVLQLAHVFGLGVVAEGVETRQQAARLRQIGYQAAQGYHFARPMRAAEISNFLSTGRPLAFVPEEPQPAAAQPRRADHEATGGNGHGPDYGRCQETAERGLAPPASGSVTTWRPRPAAPAGRTR